MRTSTDLRHKLPYQEITPEGSIIAGQGNISAGFKIESMPELFTLSLENRSKILSDLQNILETLPSNGKMQIIDKYAVRKYNGKSSDSEHFTQKMDKQYFDGMKYLEHQQEIFISINPHGSISRNIFSPKFIGIRDYLREKPYKASEQAIKDLSRAISAIENLFSYSGIKGVKMNKREVKESIWRHFRQDYSLETPDELSIPPITGAGGNLRSGGMHTRFLSLVNEPSSLKLLSDVPETSADGFKIKNGRVSSFMPYPIHHGLLCNHTVYTTIEMFDRSEIEQFVNNHSKKHNIMAVLKMTDAYTLQAEAQKILAESSMQNKHICMVSVSLSVSAGSEPEVEKHADLAENSFKKFGAGAWTENEDDANMLWATAPGNAGTNYRALLTTADRATRYVNTETPFIGHKKGIRFCERAYGKPVFLDIISQQLTQAKHFGIFAPTRSGKTFAMQKLVAELINVFKAHAIIVDRGKSYRRLAKIVPQTKYYGANDFFTIGMNPFMCPKDIHGNYIFFDKEADSEELQQIDIAVAICTLVWTKGKESLGIDNEAILKEIIEESYKKCSETGEIPNLKVINKYASEFIKNKTEGEDNIYGRFPLDSMKLHFREYCEGEKAMLVNSNDQLDMEKDVLTVFEMGGIHGIDAQIVELCIANLALSKFNRLPPEILKYLILDEAIEALTGVLGDKIGGFYRKAAKLGGAVGTITQSVEYLLQADELVRTSILSNMPIKILLGIENEEAQIKATKEMLSLDERDMYMLRSMNSKAHELFIKVGDTPFVLRNEVSPVCQKIYTTNSEEITRMNELEKITGSIEAASIIYAAEGGYASGELKMFMDKDVV